MGRLDGRVAIVTGASSGIGNAIAAAYGREGASLILADVRREPKLDDEGSVFEKLEGSETPYRFVETDVSDPAACERVVDRAVSEFSGLDVLVNNAGIYYQDEAHETSITDFDETIAVNLRGVFCLAKAAIPALRESEYGRIINLSSIYGLVGGPGSAAYCASKGGVSNLTRGMALDYAADEITVNALAPGIIETAQNAAWRESDPDLVDDWQRSTPWPRFGTPEDVAGPAVFLASAESEFVTGHVLSVDGGWTAR